MCPHCGKYLVLYVENQTICSSDEGCGCSFDAAGKEMTNGSFDCPVAYPDLAREREAAAAKAAADAAEAAAKAEADAAAKAAADAAGAADAPTTTRTRGG